MSVRVTIEVWRQESDSKIHFKLVDAPAPAATDTMVVDARANYGGATPSCTRRWMPCSRLGASRGLPEST